MLSFEVVDHLCHRHPLDSFVLIDMLDNALMHEKDMRAARDIGMNGHGKNELVVLAVEVVKMILTGVSTVNKRDLLTFQISSMSLGFTKP